MDLEIIILNEVRKRQIPYDFTYMQNLKFDITEPTYETETDLEQTCACQGEVVGRGMGWEFGISRCKLIYIEWINNEVLLYSTRNYVQYPVISHNEKEYEREYTYRYD